MGGSLAHSALTRIRTWTVLTSTCFIMTDPIKDVGKSFSERLIADHPGRANDGKDDAWGRVSWFVSTLSTFLPVSILVRRSKRYRGDYPELVYIPSNPHPNSFINGFPRTRTYRGYFLATSTCLSDDELSSLLIQLFSR